MGEGHHFISYRGCGLSRSYGFNFWQRWTLGAVLFFPLTALTSCVGPQALLGDWKTGLMVWAFEDAIFGFGLALCPEAEAFRRPWWDQDIGGAE
jgi:hypothetical protein